ncbi:WAT1-related protein At1g09380-like [Miscanthus floridulus]|uniref:WAT1-related protein At1g09380-like n=1 Tax=Miscanthus floridulus TaxID=154761 RepID=UPI00345965E8
MAANGDDRQAAAAATEEEEIVVEMPVMPAPPPPVKVSPAGAGASSWETAALPLSMVVVQAFTVVLLLLSKLALNTGMRPCVLIVHRNLVATAAVAPLAFFFEREMWKKLNLAVLGWISLNATFAVVLAMGLYYYGLQVTSAAYSVVFLNLIPIVTFVIAILVRAEKVALGKWPGKLKVLGALTCVGGTMIVSLLKGRLLHLWPSHLLKTSDAGAPASGGHHRDMLTGTLFLCGSCLSYALWFIVQARLGKVFPSRYWGTMLTCLSGSIQAFIISVFLSHDRADWRLKGDLQLLTVVYSGVLNTGITFVLISWAVSRRGPIYPTMFNSLSLIITTVMDSLLLGTKIYVGGVVGALLIIVGLYAFLWGKGKELQATATKKELEQEQEEEEQRRGESEMT